MIPAFLHVTRKRKLGKAARFRVGQRVTAIHAEHGEVRSASDNVQALRRDEVMVAEKWWSASEVRPGSR